jgi:glycosyltransferase AglD
LRGPLSGQYTSSFDICEQEPSVLRAVLVIPVHNEEKFIKSTIESLEHHIFYLAEKYSITILIAEDGSTDNSTNIMTELSSKYSNILIRHNPSRLGRGKAVKNAWRDIGDVDIYAYVDADMATRISCLDMMLNLCGKEGYDVVSGSRYLPSSEVKRPLLRKAVSKLYNLVVNLLFGTTIKDHQCGFKAITKRACKIILKESTFDDWFWDTELFVIAHRKGLKVLEFPVAWEERRGSKTPIRRLLKDLWIHGSGLLKLLVKVNLFPS